MARRAELDVIALADGLATLHRTLLQTFDALSDEDLAAMAVAPWGERMSLLSFLYEMALHNSTPSQGAGNTAAVCAARGRTKR